jgi:uncharacterized protein YjaZ
MPIQNVSIGVFDAPELVIPEYGISGRAHGRSGEDPTSFIELDLDPESPHKETAIGEDLRKTIRHESHHDQRFESLGQDNRQTLLDALIFEGLATHYEIEGSDDDPSLYATALTPEQIPALLARAREEFSSEDPAVMHEWLFGSEEKNIPRWAGYALECHLVGEYLKTHPDKKPSTLYATQAEEFVPEQPSIDKND